MKLRNRIYQFMQGRNGVDALARFINIAGLSFLLTALLFTILSTAFWRHGMQGPATVFTVLHYVFYGIGLILMILWIFRILSAMLQSGRQRILDFFIPDKKYAENAAS